MICPHCFIDMVPGIALKESCCANCICECETVYTWETLEMIDCLKCPSCGHSEDEKRRD